jgi:hypothetical protein
MRLVNYSKIPDEKITEYFDFCAKPLGLTTMKVVCKNTKHVRGFCGFSFSDRKEIWIGVGDPSRDKQTYPYILGTDKVVIDSNDRWQWNTGKKAYEVKPGYVDKFRENSHLPILILSKEEYIIHLMAHELRHHWQQKRRPRFEWVFGSNNGKLSKFGIERDSNVFALRMLRQWRKLHAVDIYLEQPDMLVAAISF